MKKHLLIAISFFLLLSIVFCGCFQEKPKTDSEKLVGTWVSEDSDFRMYKFFGDGTCLINNYELKGTYYINSKGKLVINQTAPHVSYIYAYSLNADNTKLSLSEDETGDYHTFRKQ